MRIKIIEGMGLYLQVPRFFGVTFLCNDHGLVGKSFLDVTSIKILDWSAWLLNIAKSPKGASS